MKLLSDPTRENDMNNALSYLDNESRLITTPWSRIVRGLGLGQYPMKYSEAISQWIQNTFDELKNKTDAANNYVTFSSLLCDFICLLIKPNQKISEKDIEDARSILDCGIDFNGNKEANFKNDILKKCRDQGLDLGAWTINDPEVMKKLEKNGVTLITTDSIEYDK